MVTMNTLAQRFLRKEEQERITQTVREMERQTSGEIVPMVVSASHSYPEATLTGAALLSFPLALLAAFAAGNLLWWRGEVLWLFLLFFLLFFTGARLLMRSPALLRPFIRDTRAEAEVRRAALAHFYSEGLQHTRDATGVLIYISVLERKVWILGDRGINERLAPQTWQHCVDRLVQGIKEKRQGAALCATIAEIGSLLREHFPIKADDRNELSDLMIVDAESDAGKRQLVVR
jgi:putative membrane protein